MVIEAAREAEVQKLIRVYRKAVLDLARDFVAGIDFDRPRTFALLQQALQRLNELDAFAGRWARRNVARLYEAAQRDTIRELRSLGLTRRDVAQAKQFALINQRAVEALVIDPQVGFLSAMTDATEQIRERLRLIHTQARVLRAQQATINETIARVGVLEGRNINTVKRELVRELTSKKAQADLVLRPALNKQGGNHIFANMANTPFVKIPTSQGDRHLRLDDYAEMVARTKSRQAASLATRNAGLQNGRDLVQISPNRALEDDACDLYITRVFALTPDAAAQWGVPRVEELPNGGTPFHPNCTHNELVYFPEFKTDLQMQRDMSRPPDWALNRTWNEVNKEYKRRGGLSFVQQTNPNFAEAQNSGGRRRLEEEKRREARRKRRRREQVAKRRRRS